MCLAGKSIHQFKGEENAPLLQSPAAGGLPPFVLVVMVVVCSAIAADSVVVLVVVACVLSYPNKNQSMSYKKKKEHLTGPL